MRFSNRSPTAPSFRPMERPLPTSGSNATSPPKFISASSATASSSSAPIAFKLHFSWALHPTGQTVSRLGSVVTRTALPLVALLTLGAGPPELAFLVISSSAGTLLVGLVAGAWVDRLRRRPVLVWTDVIRAALLFWIPIAYAI